LVPPKSIIAIMNILLLNCCKFVRLPKQHCIPIYSVIVNNTRFNLPREVLNLR
jgi:hypothetical protein